MLLFDSPRCLMSLTRGLNYRIGGTIIAQASLKIKTGLIRLISQNQAVIIGLYRIFN